MAGFGMKVKISAYAYPMLVFGLILNFQKTKELKGIGNILAGMGLLFLGIAFMKGGFESFKSAIDLSQYGMPGFGGLLLFTGIGIMATVVMQSSHATLMLIIAGLAAGQISYENALALAIGANVGTTITAIIGAISANIVGKRLAGAHLIFNTTTGLIAVIFMTQPFGGLMAAVQYVSTAVGIDPNDFTLQLAVFHTIFNVIGVAVMIPFVNHLTRFLENKLKEKASSMDQPQHLNESAIALPDTALKVMQKESVHLWDNSYEILAHGLNLQRTDINSSSSIDDVLKKSAKVLDVSVHDLYYSKVKSIYNEIVSFSSRAQDKMTEKQVNRAYRIRLSCRSLAQSIKYLSYMRDNINLNLQSDNEELKAQYNLFRKSIGEILRETDRLRNIKEGQTVTHILDKLKEGLEATDVASNGGLERLVKNKLITSQQASSLINDSSYAYDIGKMLIEFSEIIFIPEEYNLKDTEEILREDNDFRELPTQRKKEVWSEAVRKAMKEKEKELAEAAAGGAKPATS